LPTADDIDIISQYDIDIISQYDIDIIISSQYDIDVISQNGLMISILTIDVCYVNKKDFYVIVMSPYNSVMPHISRRYSLSKAF